MSMMAFLAGLGGGYVKGTQQNIENERQAKMDKIVTDRADREAAEYQKKTDFETQLADAGKAVVAEQPNDVLKDDDGNDMPAAPAFRAGGQRYASMAEAQAAADKANTQEAIAGRQAQVFNAHGKPLEAIQMSNAVMDSKLKKLGLSSAEAKFADEDFNRQLVQKISSKATPEDGIAHVLTETNLGALNGVSVTPRPSKDGKSVDYVGVGKDGAQKVLMSLPKGELGVSKFLQDSGRVSLESKIGYLNERYKSEKEDARWQQEFGLRKNEFESNSQYKSRVLGFQESAEKRATDLHKISLDNAKVPDAVRQLATSYKEQIKSASDALNKSMAEGNFDPNNKGTLQLMKDQKLAMQGLSDVLAPYTSKAKDGADSARPLGEVNTNMPNSPASSAAPATQQQQPPAATSPSAKVQTAPPSYVPPAESPAGKAAANRMQLQVQSMQRIQETKNAALAAIQSGDPVAADAVRGMPEFMALPTEQKVQIRKIIFGR